MSRDDIAARDVARPRGRRRPTDDDEEPVEDFCEECGAELRASDREDGFCLDCGGAV